MANRTGNRLPRASNRDRQRDETRQATPVESTVRRRTMADGGGRRRIRDGHPRRGCKTPTLTPVIGMVRSVSASRPRVLTGNRTPIRSAETDAIVTVREIPRPTLITHRGHTPVALVTTIRRG